MIIADSVHLISVASLRAIFPYVNRCIVRERDPTFEGSFVESCLLIVGKIDGVWGNFSDVLPAGDIPTMPMTDGPTGATDEQIKRETKQMPVVADMLDFLLLHEDRATRTRVSAREAFWYAGQGGKREITEGAGPRATCFSFTEPRSIGYYILSNNTCYSMSSRESCSLIDIRWGGITKLSHQMCAQIVSVNRACTCNIFNLSLCQHWLMARFSLLVPRTPHCHLDH